MKKILLLGIIITIFATLHAQEGTSVSGTNKATQRETHVTPAQALNVGYAFMRTGEGSKSNGTKSGNVSKQAMQLIYTGQTIDSLTGDTTDCYYVFALPPKGFVIVAADERVEPILGYSYDNDFVVENMPDHVRDWLNNYERQIEAVTKSDLQSDPVREAKWTQLKNGNAMNTRSGETVGPLLTTTWDQGQYYNSLCPTDANGPAGHVYTGCVATAMAQIINYWGYPAHGRGTHSYESNYGNLTVNYDSALYEYTNMPNALTFTSTPDEVNAVATLMRDCGVAVNMEYYDDESAALNQNARAALINFYRYSPDLSYAEKEYFSDSEWDELLHTELDNQRPVFYSGQGSGGHAFVCDGYDANGYYHFNFGWGGFADGYFLTNAITPSGSDFNNDQSVILGIVPDSTGNVILGQTRGNSTFYVDEPLEFYHIMGHNAYEGGNYSNHCSNMTYFISADSAENLVADVIEFEDQNLGIYDGLNNLIRVFNGGGYNDYSPVVSNDDVLTFDYQGNLYYSGFKFRISKTNGCRMVSNITTFVDTTTVHLTWTENSLATQWEIEYGVEGFELGTGTIYTASTNTVTFNNLIELTEYDFYIRSVCDSNNYGPWSKVSVLVDGYFWQDIVTSQPEGYVYDPETNSVEISTAEELTWWAKNGNNVDGRLVADIDLSGYKWRPTELSGRNINGQGHVITNAYILQGNGFFSECDQNSVIEDLGLTNAYIKSNSEVGGLCNDMNGTMRNCYISNSTIIGGNNVGGLVNLNSGMMVNCYINADVIGNSQAGLMTCNSNGTMRNCYAGGKLRIRTWCFNAGIVAVVQEGEISHCYSVEAGMGVVGAAVGTAIISDISIFARSGNDWALSTPIVFNETTETDLLSALNRGVELFNNSDYCTWTADTGNVNGGYPVFGAKLIVQCPNVTAVKVQSINMDTTYAVKISWEEHGNAMQWRIRYRRHNMPDSAYTYVVATSNPYIIYGIPLGFEYDFNVRAICYADNISGWSETTTTVIDRLYWTDVVTSQPAGYVEDADGNVEIYSAEGLAWLSVITNGFHNQQPNSFKGKTVTLKSDINIEGYRWYPIGLYFKTESETPYSPVLISGGFSGSFDGQNHSISNIYMNSDTCGLFGTIFLGRVKNVNLDGGYIIGNGGGGLINHALDCYEISNCHSSATVYSKGRVGDYFYSGRAGSICGEVETPNFSQAHYELNNYDPFKTIVSNCSSSGTVFGGNDCGNLLGHVYGNVEIRNCYATGDVNLAEEFSYGAQWRGGLIGYLMEGSTSTYNCFSTGSVESCSGKVIGCTASAVGANSHIHYIYSRDDVNVGSNLIGSYSDDIADTSQFHHDGNSNVLSSPVFIGGATYSNLLDALNAWVTFQNDSTLKTWVLDTLTGYPVFGNYFTPPCFNPTNLTVSQATEVGDATIKTRLSWEQDGNPEHWEVLCVTAGELISSDHDGTIISVNSNPCVLAGIPIGQPLDFYVRAICGEDEASGWCGPVTYIPDKLRWTEVVTTKPEGFQVDDNYNVYISSAEGLSWLSSVVNELNGNNNSGISNWWSYVNVILTEDIDLSAYRWTAIESDYLIDFSFEGNNHVISGLYCNELSSYQGLFGSMGGEIKNLIMTDCYVRGDWCVGTIVGGFGSPDIVNCTVKGNVSGAGKVGGIIGEQYGGNVENSYFIGSVSGSTYVGEISGVTYSGAINNCYVVSEIANEVSKRYFYSNVSDFSGGGYTWTLSTPPYINGAFHSDLLDALNTWVDVNNTDGQYLHWVADTTMVNDGYPIFESVTYPVVTAQDTLMAAGYYSWHGMVLLSDTMLTDTIPTLYGYDSIVTYHIIITPTLLTNVTIDTCGSYVWNGNTYVESGIYAQRLTAEGGGDSVVVLNLIINPSTGVDEHFVCDNSYTWIDGVTYVADNNTATYTFHTDDGCDSIVTLHLTFGYRNTGDTTAVACDSFDWYDLMNLTQSGDYIRTLTNASGCDSVVTLHLTIGHTTHNVETEIACDSYTWHGVTYNTSGTYNYEYINSDGCASVDTLLLTINFATFAQFADTAYDSYTWNGQIYTASGDYTQTFTNAAGCDSVVTLHLTLTVGIEDHNLGASMNLYPNPTNSIVNVECTMNNVQKGAVEFQLFDAFGRLLRTTDGVGANNYSPLRTDTHGSSIQTAQIDLSEFAAGVYFVKAVADGNVMAVRKVVKQ